MPYQNFKFSPPGKSEPALTMPALAGSAPAAIPHHVAQFRRDFPAIARCLDAMRKKSAMSAATAGGSEV